MVSGGYPPEPGHLTMLKFNKQMKNLFLIALGLSFSGLSVAATWDTKAIDSRVQTLLEQMTLEEKAGQLVTVAIYRSKLFIQYSGGPKSAIRR